MYDIKQYRKVENKPRSPFVKVLRYMLIIFMLFFAIFVFFHKEGNNQTTGEALFISPLSEVVKKTVVFLNSQENSKNLSFIVQNALKNQTSQYSLYIDNLNSGERFYLNETKKYKTASLYKLWVMATVFTKIKSGNINKTDVLTEDISVLNEKFNIATDSAELTKGELSLPVQNLLDRMINISDNYSALLLTEKIGLSNVALFLKQNGFLDSKVGSSNDSPISNAKDIGLFFEKLYDGKLVDKNYSDEMISLLKKQQLNSKLPNDLPQNTVIAHKTGELDNNSHDGGIVFTKKGNYIIVMLSETASPKDANIKIAEVSKKVYDYFTK